MLVAGCVLVVAVCCVVFVTCRFTVCDDDVVVVICCCSCMFDYCVLSVVGYCCSLSVAAFTVVGTTVAKYCHCCCRWPLLVVRCLLCVACCLLFAVC